VCVTGLTVSDGLRVSRAASLDEIAGWRPEEVTASVPWRWTAGVLELPSRLWSGCRDQAVLTFALNSGLGGAWIAPGGEELRDAA
jgi:hypothetical protein